MNFIKFFLISFKMFAISEQEQTPAIVAGQDQNAYSLRNLTIGVGFIVFKGKQITFKY